MQYYKAASLGEIPAGEKKKVQAGGRTILLCNVSGAVYAIPDQCPHMGASLFEGTLAGEIITCPRHGSKFDVTTGKNVGSANILFVKMKVKDTVSIPVKIEDGDIYIQME